MMKLDKNLFCKNKKINLIGYLNLALLKKFSQRIGYKFYIQKTQLKVLYISIMIISYGTINLSTLSNKLLYNKLVNVKFSKLISAYHWINYLVLSEKLNTSSLYIFIFKFLEEKKLNGSDGNSFSLLFQIKFYFSNGKLLGIVYYLCLFK